MEQDVGCWRLIHKSYREEKKTFKENRFLNIIKSFSLYGLMTGSLRSKIRTAEFNYLKYGLHVVRKH